MPKAYYFIYKPFNYLSQFSKDHPDHLTLADLDFNFPKDVYPIGRLDKDSEGLLLLSNDKQLNHQLLNPKHLHQRTYWAQVDGAITSEAIEQLTSGVTIRINKKPYHTKPAIVSLLTPPPTLPERNPPIRYRKNIPTSWVSLSLTEGKNRQVRRMCAAVGFPVLRLVRVQIEQLGLQELKPGEVRSIAGLELKQLLKI